MGRRAVETHAFGERLKDLRGQLGLSQEAFAERAGPGFDREILSKIENGANKATTSDIREALARGLGVNEETLRRFWENGLSVDEMVQLAREGSVVSQRPAQPRSVDPAASHGELRWQALVELIRDKVPADDAIRAVLKAQPTERPLTWGDFLRAAKAILNPRRVDFGVDNELPAGTSAERVRNRFAGAKKGR